jgi:hypothetical protein
VGRVSAGGGAGSGVTPTPDRAATDFLRWQAKRVVHPIGDLVCKLLSHQGM